MSARAWLFDHWRLKLLAAVLAIVLFGAVAFSQNPVIFKTLNVKIDGYQLNQGVALVNQPTRVNVVIFGPQSSVNSVTSDDVRAVLDASRVPVPQNGPQIQKVNVQIQVAASDVNIQQSAIPFYVKVDKLDPTGVDLPIKVRDRPGPGWTIDSTSIADSISKAPASTVHLVGPDSILSGLQAFVDVGQIAADDSTFSVKLGYADSHGNTEQWPPLTEPGVTATVNFVDVNVKAHQALFQKLVPLTVDVTGTPACGYEVSGLSWNPGQLVTVFASAEALQNITSISVSSIDVTGATSDVSVRRSVVQSGVDHLSPSAVTVTASIKQGFTCTPASPQPAPSPVPSATP